MGYDLLRLSMSLVSDAKEVPGVTTNEGKEQVKGMGKRWVVVGYLIASNTEMTRP